MIQAIRYAVVLALLFASCPAYADEVRSTSKDQTDLKVTIYNNDLALIRDKRNVTLPKGLRTLAFREVSSQMKPETALFTGSGTQVLEQNFEFDLLSPESMLQKYVGKDVILYTINPATGEEKEQTAKVLSAGKGTVLKVGKDIITKINGQIRYPDVPANLRDRPTLTMLVDTESTGEREVELTYLTNGLSWNADYTAELNEMDDQLHLNGWVTLENRSGITYHDANLQLVAGEVNIIHEQKNVLLRSKILSISEEDSAAGQPMQEEAMFEYHLYSLGRKTTIKENQQKQLSLMQAPKVACSKRYIFRGQPFYYQSRYRNKNKTHAEVLLELQNDTESGLGQPLPAGTMRVYKKDSKGFLQFVGEDRIEHTPVNEDIRLKLGDAFDLTAERTQLDFQKISRGLGNYAFESEHKISIKNAKKEAVTVHIEEPIQGTWKMIRESDAHKKIDAHTLSWAIEVPAEGNRTLSYKVQVIF